VPSSIARQCTMASQGVLAHIVVGSPHRYPHPIECAIVAARRSVRHPFRIRKTASCEMSKHLSKLIALYTINSHRRIVPGGARPPRSLSRRSDNQSEVRITVPLGPRRSISTANPRGVMLPGPLRIPGSGRAWRGGCSRRWDINLACLASEFARSPTRLAGLLKLQSVANYMRQRGDRAPSRFCSRDRCGASIRLHPTPSLRNQ
jgi:hypothetical protein